MNMTPFPLDPLIAGRWSPRAFSPDMPSDREIGSIMTAAQWAPSCFNEQPWSFFVGKQGDKTYNAILAALVEGNQTWAKSAPVLMVSIAKTTFSHNGKPNPHAWHDVGLAVENAILQARSLGFQSHQMAGFSPQAIAESFGIPDGFEPIAVIAFGRELGDGRDKPGTRKSLSDFVFAGSWNKARDMG